MSCFWECVKVALVYSVITGSLIMSLHTVAASHLLMEVDHTASLFIEYTRNIISQPKFALNERSTFIYIWKIRRQNHLRSLLRPISNHTCQQHSNPSGDPVPLKGEVKKYICWIPIWFSMIDTNGQENYCQLQRKCPILNSKSKSLQSSRVKLLWPTYLG
jgi:hypothetical protein